MKKGFLALPLIFLAAAAAPGTDCSQPAPSADHAQAVSGSVAAPTAYDSTMTTQSNAVPAIRQLLAGCGSASASADSSSLHQGNDEVLHGLEPGAALAPVDQPRNAPLFR